MNHRDLLKRYMRRIRDSEGALFLPHGASDRRTPGGAPTVAFTDAEVRELEVLAAEGDADEDREMAATTS